MAFMSAWRRMTVYVVFDADGRRQWRYTLRPHVDAAWWKEQGARHLIPLRPPIPALWAEFACRTAARFDESTRLNDSDGFPNMPAIGRTQSSRVRWSKPLSSFLRRFGGAIGQLSNNGRGRFVRRIMARSVVPFAFGGPDIPAEAIPPVVVCVAGVNRALRIAGYDTTLHPGEPISLQTHPNESGSAGSLVVPSATDIDAISSAVTGRLLSVREIERFVERGHAVIQRSVADCLSWLALAGDVETMPGVRRERLGVLRCGRCGETERLRAWDCAVCGEEQCWMCEACRSMGQVRACTVLYAGTAGPAATAGNVGAGAAARPAEIVAVGPSRSADTSGTIGGAVSPRLVGTTETVAMGGVGETAGTSAAIATAATSVTVRTTATVPTIATVATLATDAASAGGESSAAPSLHIRMPTLTPAQRRASHALEAFVDAPGPTAVRDALVWAVCGAGKTEMSFAAVGRVLTRGGRVLFAIPRRDVVREMGERLRAAFPGVELQVLHGGHDRTVLPVLSHGSITVATTHQVLRFYRAFDLVILDEVDAFPYRGSRMLADAVARATVPNGWRIRMTATPDRELLRRANDGTSVLVRVPVRHHGHPLPVPELIIDKSLDNVEQTVGSGRQRPFRASRRLLLLIERSINGPDPARMLIFVPTIALAERVGAGLAKQLGAADHGGVLWSHSRDGQRQHKLAAFLAGQARVFVATSILERGVTVPDVDVIVLYSDAERIFQEPALIQMAGRVGRTVTRPTGHVAFVGRRITRSMHTAVAHIESMNEEASALGLLRGSTNSQQDGSERSRECRREGPSPHQRSRGDDRHQRFSRGDGSPHRSLEASSQEKATEAVTVR